MKWEFRVVESKIRVEIVDNIAYEFIEYDYLPCYGVVMCKVDESGVVTSTDGNFVQMSGGDLHELQATLKEALGALDKPVIKYLNK